MQWFPLQILVLSLVCLHGALRTEAAVVSAVSEDPECRALAYKGVPPVGITEPTMKKICQFYRDVPRYITLYLPLLRIPILSAYTLKNSNGESVKYDLMYERQLAYPNADKNMVEFPEAPLDPLVENIQTVPEDYSGMIDYELGQLNPPEHQLTVEDRTSTFTVTNAVPRIRDHTAWKNNEKKILERLNKHCRGTAYIVTGVIPSKQMLQREGKDRVAIPESLWSAYCCDDVNPDDPIDQAKGFITKNEATGKVTEMTLSELEDELKTKLPVDSTFHIFQDNCGLSS